VAVTGASAGLGEEFARQLAGRCNALVLIARRGERLRTLASRLELEHPGLQVHAAECDLTDPAQRRRLAGALLEANLVPDLLINNAGLGDYGEFATAEWPRVEAMLRVNIEALTHLTHLWLPAMRAAKRGAIVNVSSFASLLPIPDFAVYAATKAYVTSFSEALRIELRGSGVRVLAVCPGPVQTEFGGVAQRPAGGTRPPIYQWAYVPKEQVVAEAIRAMDADRPRVYPGWQMLAAAVIVGLVPICLLRRMLARRPRRTTG
jgi:short-subunit dehydrogenase